MLCLLLHLCLLYFNIYHIYSYETFVLPYFDVDKGRMTILYFGEHVTGVYGILSLTSQYTLLTNQSSYKRELSSSYKLNSVNQTIANIYDVFQTGRYNSKGVALLNFYCYNENINDDIEDNIFGFSLKFDSPSFSIVHQLYDKGLIDENAFGLSPFYDEDQGDIYIGKLPSYVIENKVKVVCDVNINYFGWNCYLRYVYIGNDKYKGYHLNVIGTFVSDRRDIVVGKNLWEFFVANIFEKYFFENKICEYENITDSHYRRIKCNCSNVNQIPQIVFVIGKYELHFKEYDLFTSTIFHTCRFNIIYNTQQDPNTILIGTAFYKNFFIYFKYTQKQIEIFSRNSIILTDLNDSFLNETKLKYNEHQIKLIYIILLYLLTSNSLLLFYDIYKY